MSLPLQHRIARAALLIGAAAAPLAGAGSAHAAAAPRHDLRGLSRIDRGGIDTDGLGGRVRGTSHDVTTLVGTTGVQTLQTTLPAADRVVGTLSNARLPAARKAAGQAADATGQAIGGVTESASAQTLPTSTLPNAGALPLAAALPTFGVLTDRLPMNGLPVR